MSVSIDSLAVLGCGTMGQAILGGLLATGALDPARATASVRSAKRAEAVRAKLGISVFRDNVSAVRDAQVVVLAVKPQIAREVLQDPALVEALAGKVVISICAGVSLAQLDALVPGAVLMRAMPNTPCVIREGMTVVCPGPRATDEHVALAESIFGAVGRVRVLEEKHLDAVTGLSGSGPAFVCVILESLADGGVMMGLPREVAVELAAQTMQGAARLVLETGLHPAALKDQVTTPAGCTIAGLLTMEDRGIRSTLARTIEEATRVASGLGGAGKSCG